MRSLDVSCCNITTRSLERLVESCPGLELLKLLDWLLVDDMRVKKVGESCSKLLSLNLSYTNVSDIGVLIIAQCCSGLQILTLEEYRRICDLSITQIVARCPNISSLDLRSCNVTNNSLILIAKYYKHIHTLRLQRTPISSAISDDNINTLVYACNQSKTLEICNCQISKNCRIKEVNPSLDLIWKRNK